MKASNARDVNDAFGFSVAISGDVAVVGAAFENRNVVGVNGVQAGIANNSGAAYVFDRSGLIWTQRAYLKAFNTGGGR